MLSRRIRSVLKSRYKVRFSRWADVCYECLSEGKRMLVDVAVLGAQLAGGGLFRRCRSHRIAVLEAGDLYILVAKERDGLLVLDIQRDCEANDSRPDRRKSA